MYKPNLVISLNNVAFKTEPFPLFPSTLFCALCSLEPPLTRERERDSASYNVSREEESKLSSDNGMQRRRVRFDSRRSWRDSASLKKLVPLLHARRRWSWKPFPWTNTASLITIRHYFLPIRIRISWNPDPHLHLLRWSQNPRYRTRLSRSSSTVRPPYPQI